MNILKRKRVWALLFPLIVLVCLFAPTVASALDNPSCYAYSPWKEGYYVYAAGELDSGDYTLTTVYERIDLQHWRGGTTYVNARTAQCWLTSLGPDETLYGETDGCHQFTGQWFRTHQYCSWYYGGDFYSSEHYTAKVYV